jgi:cell division protein ZipA
MGELRWILLLAGLVFLAALAAWEHFRPRQGRRDENAPAARSERSEPPMGTMGAGAAAATAGSAAATEEAASSGARIYTGASLGGGRTRSEPPPRIDLPPLEPITADSAGGTTGRRIADSAIVFDEPMSADGPGPADDAAEAAPYYVYARAESSNGMTAAEALLPGELPRPPVVDWPPESERHILSLRIAALGHERLSGRVVRLALGACGFEHGRFGIFHQPGADGRALLSAANLSKPGIFDLPNMDFQRFSGLSLFAVLPGPLPPAAALDHLLDTAQDLAERLRARLQDEQGLALGATQLETLRRTVQDLTQAAPAEPTS